MWQAAGVALVYSPDRWQLPYGITAVAVAAPDY